MRHLVLRDARSALGRGRSIEQLLPDRQDSGLRIIRYVRLDKEPSGAYSTTLFEVIDAGSHEFADVYAFDPLEPDFPDGVIRSFGTADEAIEFTMSSLGASGDSFVNAGVIQDEYLDTYFHK